MDKNQTIDYFLKIGWQTVANKYNQIAARYGFTQATGYILINIHKDGTPVSQIANLTGVKTTSLSRVLNNLESAGLIHREASETDKRSVIVHLTALGQEKRAVAKDVVRKFNQYLEDRFTDSEREALVNGLVKLNALAAHYDEEVNV